MDDHNLSNSQWKPAAHRWVVPVALVALVLLLVAAFSVRPIYRRIRRTKANEFALTAKDLISQGKLDQAAPLVRAGLQLDPSEPEVTRQAARFFTEEQQPQAKVFWTQLMDRGRATDDDLLSFAQFSIDRGRPDLALEKLRSMGTNLAPEVLLLRATLATNVADAVRDLEMVWQGATNSRLRYEAATLLHESADPSAHVLGRQRLIGLAGEGDVASQAYVLCSPFDAQAFAIAVEAQRKNIWLPPWDLAADYVLGRATNALPRLLDTLRETPENLRLAIFLRLHEVDVASPELIRSLGGKNPQLFSFQMDVLVSQDRWAEILPALEDPRIKLPVTARNGLRAAAFRHLGKALDAEVEEQSLVSQLSKVPVQLLQVGQMASWTKNPHLEAACWKSLIFYAEFRQVAGTNLFQLGMGHGEVNWAATGAEAIARGDTSSPWYSSQVYLRLLGNPESAKLLPAPKGDFPDDQIARSLLAVHQGRATDAIDLLEPMALANRIPTRAQAVLAYAYARNGQRILAAETAAKVDRKNLLTEERRQLLFEENQKKP